MVDWKLVQLIQTFKMADSGDFLIADEKTTNMQYVNNIEYLSEWPPIEERGQSEKLTRRKRQKVDRAEERSLCDGLVSEGVLWARPALARWWRKRQSDGIHIHFKNMPKSDNPNTLLKYVAR